MATSTVTDWDEIEADPEFSSLPQESRVRLFDDWEKKFNRTLLEDADLDKVKPEGINRFAVTNAVRRRKLAGEDVRDPNATAKEWSTQKQAEAKLGQQMLKDYADVEDKKFRLDDARSMPGVDDLGRAAPWWEEGVEKATKDLEAAEAKFTPEVRAQAQAASEALKGKRKIATLNGSIYTDPALVLDKDEFRKQVLDSDAPPEAKALKLASFQNEKKRYLDEAINTLTKGDPQIPLAESFPKFLEAKGFDLDREMAKQSEGKLDYSPIQKQRELAQEYLTKMQDRGWFRKIGSAISTGVATGMLDIGTQAVGTAAMLTGDEEKSKVAAELSRASGDIGAAQGLEGDMQATGGTFAGGVTRLGVGMAPMLLPGGAVGGIARLAGAGAGAATAAAVGASALTAGAQTAGSQFGEVYGHLRQQDKTHEQAFGVSRNAAVLSGAVTTALTALGGATGVESLLRQGGKELVKSRLVAALKAVPGGAAKEIAEELPDEYVSQLVSAFAKDPNASPSQVTDEFAANAPDLILQIAALGGAGSGVGRFKETTTDPTKTAQEQEFPAAGAPPDLSQRDRDNFAQGGVPIFDTEGNVTGYTAPRAAETTASNEDIRKAAEEAIKPGIPVEVNGVTIATIPEGSDMTPEDVLDFANSPEDMAMLARNGKIVLPEVVAPIEGVDPAITAEMNARFAEGKAAGDANQTLAELERQKAAQTVDTEADIPEAQIAPTVGETAAPEVDISKVGSPRLQAAIEQKPDGKTSGFRITDVDAYDDFSKQGGWKLHLSVTPENYREVDEWLHKNYKGSYKLLGGGSPEEGSDFTVYVGHKDAANNLASQIESEIGGLLNPFESGPAKDAQFNAKVGGRFDVARTGKIQDVPWTFAGMGGVPFDESAVEAIRLVGDAPKTREQFAAKATPEVERINKQLAAKYGNRYTGTAAETLGVTPPPAPTLEASEGAARNAEMLRQAAARAAGTEQGPRIGFLQSPSPAVTEDTYYHGSNEDFETFGTVRHAQTAQGRKSSVTPITKESRGQIYLTQDQDYAGTYGDKVKSFKIGNARLASFEDLGHRDVSADQMNEVLAGMGVDHAVKGEPRPTFEWLKYGNLKKPLVEAGFDGFRLQESRSDNGRVVKTVALFDNAKVSPVTTTNETPSNAANAAGGSQSVQTEPAEGSIPTVTEDTVSISDIPSTAETKDEPFGKLPTKEVETELSRRTKQAEEEEAREKVEAPKRREETIKKFVVEGAVVQTRKKVVGRKKAAEGGGDITQTENFLVHPDKREIPLSASEAKNLSAQVLEPGEESSIRTTPGEESPTISDPQAEWSPTPGQPATANINGQKVVGTVGPSTGKGLVSFQYEWNGKTQKATVRPDRLSRPVASLTEPPSYEYTQEQNTRKMGKHFPTAPGLYANHDFRKSLASMAEDTSLSRIYRQIAKIMSKMDAFANIDLHIVADGDIGYAGEYSHSNGKSAIAVNLRQVARGKVDALGTILHEALHHITLAKVRNPQGAFENDVVQTLDQIRQRVVEYAKQQGLGKRLGYEINTLEEFISALTSPDFQNFLASIPDSFSTGVSVGKFRSALSEVFRLIAELIKGEPVARGSTMEQYFTTVLALFETPHRTLDIGKLEKLSAVQSKPGYRTPADMLAETAGKLKGDVTGTKPQGLASMFKPQAKRPATGERKLLDMPVRNTLANAYREAVRGSSTQMAPLSSVYAQARLLQPGLTPEAFLAQVQEGYDNGTLLLEGAGSQQEAEQAGLALPGTPVGTAVRMMPAPETPKSLVDEETDAAYLAAVEAGDMGTAQQMVDEAAKSAGYEKRWNFSENIGIDPNRGAFYTTSNKSAADSWGEGREGKTRPVFISSKAPAIEGKNILSSSFMTPELAGKLKAAGFDSASGGRDWKRGDEIAVFSPNQIKSADPVTRDKAGNVIPPSQRFNPQSPSILYAAPINPNQSNEREDIRPQNAPPSTAAGGTRLTPTEGGVYPMSVLARLDAAREAAVSAAVAESDWGNYTPEQKTEALNSFIRSTYAAADYSSWAQLRDVGGLVLTRGGKGSASVRSSVGADGRLNLELTYDNTERSLPGVMGGIPAREMFAFSYDTAQEEIIHAADKIGAFQRGKDAGRPGTFVEFERGEAKATVTQLNQTRLSLQESDPAASQKIKEAMLASWNIYHADDQVPGINGLLNRLDQTKNDPALYLYELRRQLTQLKRQDFTTETGWQKFRRVLEKWLTDAINSLRGVQDVFRSGMAGDLIQRQLADLEAALEGKPLPPVSRGTAASLAEGSEPPTIDIGGEAEPADGKGKQLFQKEPTAIGSTYLTPADITLQEKKTQQETLDAARKIIGEEIAKHPGNPVAGRRAALDRFSLDTSIPPEVRAVGTGVIAQQADRMANLSEGDSQLLLDEMADEAAKLSGIMSSDLEAWRNLKADANLQIDKMAEEAGRTLNIFNVFRRLTPEGFLRRMTRKYNDAVREKMGQNFDVPAGEVEAEIMRLWKMMQEAGATARGEAIAAALKAFMPRRANTRKILESLFPQAGARDRMSKGGEALVRSFFQMMAGARDQKGPLAEFDETIQGALSSMLRKVMEAKGLVAKNESVQMKDIDKLVRAISADELRFDKIAAADEAMQKELDAIEDPERRAVLQQAWEEATAKMYTNIASDATVRRALNAELKAANVDWRKMFDSNQKSDAIKAKTVDAVMAKIEALLTDSADPTVRANLGMLRSEVEAAFDFIAANKRTEWLAQREAIEARRRVAEHRAAFMEALRNQGVAEQAINRISEKLAGPQRGKPDQNPVSALVGEHMKAPVADFVDKMVALDVDRATAESLGKAASTLRSEVAAAEKLKAAERAVAQLMKSLKPKPRAPREKIERALKTLFTADTVGALDDQAFFDAFGEAFGMPPLSDEQQTRIKKLIREVNALPKGPARLDKQQDLDEELALWKGIAARDVLLSAWYANILSGVSTQGMGLLGNALNFVPRSLFNMINNPRSAGAYFKGAFGEGLSTGLKEAAAAMKGRGLYKVSKYGDKSLVSALELLRKKGPSTLPEWVAYIASAGTRLRYVFRIMQAIDALAWNTAREGHAYLAAHRALLEQEKASGTKRTPEEFSRAFIDSLGGDTAQIEEDLRAARQALIDAGQPPSMLTVDRMARETRNLRRAAGGVKAGNRFADRIVLQQDPEGSGKFISNLIDVFQKKDILGLPIGQLLIPFNRIVSNLFEQSLDYTPVGLVRAFLGGHLSDVKPGSFWNGKVEFKDKSQLFDQMERRERAMAAVTGMAAAAIIYALASAHEDEPDEDVPFMVYGWGPESKNKRAQMPKGWVPYSIKIGDNYIKFSEMPFGMMFAAAGSAMDAMRYKNMDKKTSTQRLAYVLKTAAKGFLNQGVMSSLDTAMETLMFDASEKKMADIPVNALKGLVPAQGMLRDISTIMDPNKVSSESLTSALLRDIPFAKSWGTKPDLNVFGEPIKLDGYPITRRIITHREPHAVADYLGRNELHIPGMEQTIEIGKYLPDKAKDRIQARAVELGAMENGLFTPDQNYAFKKRAGELTKMAVQEIMEKNPKISTDKQRENIQSTINKRVEVARRRAMLEAVPVK